MVERPPQPANDANAKAQERRRRIWRLTGAGILAFGLLVVLPACVLWIPKWLYPSLTASDLRDVSDAAKVQELEGARLKLQNDARTTLLQGIGALLVLTGAGIGASVTLRQVRASHDQLKLSEQGQFTDRYTKAIDQLDDKKALAVRLGGLYALERIARDSPADRATIAEVLCAYARTAPRPKPPGRPAKDSAPPVADTASAGTPAVQLPSLTERAPDVQAAVTILGRWRNRLGEPPPILDLHNADLQDAILGRAQLEGANLVGAQLQRADLGDAELQRANLIGAQLHDANLSGAQLQGAFLSDAQLQGAFLGGAQLQGARLSGAQLEDAYLTYAQLQGAQASELTRWPKGWDHARARAAGVQLVSFSGLFILPEADARSPDEPAPPGEQ